MQPLLGHHGLQDGPDLGVPIRCTLGDVLEELATAAVLFVDLVHKPSTRHGRPDHIPEIQGETNSHASLCVAGSRAWATTHCERPGTHSETATVVQGPGFLNVTQPDREAIRW